MKRSRLGEDKRSGARRLKGDTFPRQEALSQRRGRRSSPQPLGLEQAPRRPSHILQMRLLIRRKAYLTHIMRATMQAFSQMTSARLGCKQGTVYETSIPGATWQDDQHSHSL